jgi:hypothetical protein
MIQNSDANWTYQGVPLLDALEEGERARVRNRIGFGGLASCTQ